tara:strand:+ start:116 stop:364 length:249 start_codon:yes stop_codon:yes gene_type:complete
VLRGNNLFAKGKAMFDKLTIEDMTSEADQYNAQREWEKAQRESDTDRTWQMMVHNDHLPSLRVCYLCREHINKCDCPRDADH